MEIKVIFTAHVLNQMFKRDISLEDIKHILENGIVIKEYPNDKPYPSFLILGYREKRPLHIVYSENELGDKIVITAYQPDITLWEENFDRKKK